MAKKTILVSDLSGESIDEAELAQVVINTNGRRYTLDVAKAEIEELLTHGREGKRRGRPKK